MQTIVGKLIDRLGFVQQRARDDQLRTRSFALPASEFISELPRIPIDIGHDGRGVGQVQSLERTESGHLWLIGYVDDVELDTTADIFLSAEVDHRRDGHLLRSVALTEHPAAISQTPIRILNGSIQTYDRRSWPLEDGVYRQVVDHACQELRHRRASDRIRIIDPPPKLEPMGDGVWLVRDRDDEYLVGAGQDRAKVISGFPACPFR